MSTQPTFIDRAFWPLLIAVVAFGFSVAQVITQSLDLNNGMLVYGLDDAYIHMSIARNFAETGVWGITPFAFSSTTSSPLWTFMIAWVYFIVGPNVWTPLVLNIAMGVGLLVAVSGLLQRQLVPPFYRLLILLAVIVLTPLSTLVLSGMEHILHTLLAVIFIEEAVYLITDDRARRVSIFRFLRLVILGMLLGMARYEGLFLVLIVCIVLALRLRLIRAFLLGALSIVPVAVYGWIAVNNGWEWLPASLMVKSGALDYLTSVGWEARFVFLVEDTYNIFTNQHVLSGLIFAALGVYLFRFEKFRDAWDEGLVMLGVFMLVTVMSVRLVSWPDPGTFRRYEAYLIVLGIVVIAAALGRFLPRRFSLRSIPAYLLMLAALAFALDDIYDRFTFLTYENPVVTASADIYRQQVQMAEFLAFYYNDATVAVSDIGAVNYFTDIRMVDLWGLGTIEVAQARDENRLNTEFIRELTTSAGVGLAITYPDWFEPFGGLPPEWVEVGQWRLTRPPVILGGDTVTFYAVDPTLAPELVQNLRAFTPLLPDMIEVTIVDI